MPPGTPRAYKWVFTGLVAALVVYEAVALASKRDGATISEIVWRHSARRTIVPFAGGLLAGHFFWK